MFGPVRQTPFPRRGSERGRVINIFWDHFRVSIQIIGRIFPIGVSFRIFFFLLSDNGVWMVLCLLPLCEGQGGNYCRTCELRFNLEMCMVVWKCEMV